MFMMAIYSHPQQYWYMPIFSFPSANFIELRQQKNIFENDEKNTVSGRRTNAQAKTTFHGKIFAMKRQDGKIFLAYVSDDFKTKKTLFRGVEGKHPSKNNF